MQRENMHSILSCIAYMTRTQWMDETPTKRTVQHHNVYFFFDTPTVLPRRPIPPHQHSQPQSHTKKQLTSGLRVLTTHPQSPEVSETSVRTDLLQSLEIITHLRVHTVRQDLRRLAVNNVLLPVQEPCGDLELRWVLDDRHEPLELI
jgi:hypothetical protein